MYVNHKRKLIYLEHPRTGSTSTKELLRSKGFVSEGPGFDAPNVPRTGYKTFSTVRHHHDAIVSWHFAWGSCDKVTIRSIEGIKEYGLRRTGMARIPKGEGYVKKKSLWWHLPLTDTVLRFETLEADLSSLLNEEIEMPALQVSVKRGGRHYSEFYDEETAKFVSKKFSEEMKACGYKFEGKKFGGKKKKKR